MHNQNKSPKAVALQYQAISPNTKSVPKIIAKGSGNLAEEIIALAEQHGIFIHQDEHLSDILSQLDLGQEIPESMYYVIAELIAFSFVLQGKFPETWHNIHQKIDFAE
jgi:flagellar biosynthesis protein